MKKLRIGILTFHFSDNYGAALQAYALRKWFIENGFCADFVPYHPTHVEDGGKLFFPRNSRDVKKNLKSIFLKISNVTKKLDKKKIDQALKFDNFREKFLGQSGGDRILTKEGVEEYVKGRYDVLVCGSDQIWSPSDQNGVDPVYFLNFDKNGIKSISYAPSFGSVNIDKSYWDDIVSGVKSLDFVSVRENNAAVFLNSICGYECSIVPDPVILLGNFSDFIDEAEKIPNVSGGVFSYALRSPNGIREVCEKLQDKFDIPINSPINPHRRWREIGETFSCSASGWVYALSESKFVVTNSFHGVVFSLVLNKKFIAFKLPGKKEAVSDRLIDILAKVGLSDRIFHSEDYDAAFKKINEDIDWISVNEKMMEMKNSGEAWLLNALNYENI